MHAGPIRGVGHWALIGHRRLKLLGSLVVGPPARAAWGRMNDPLLSSGGVERRQDRDEGSDNCNRLVASRVSATLAKIRTDPRRFSLMLCDNPFGEMVPHAGGR